MKQSIHAYLRTHIDQLKQEAEESSRRRQGELERSKQQLKPNSLQPAKPLDVQITELMATLPPTQRDRKWSMAELVSRLDGRYRDRPHPQMVGEALRRLGWSTGRNWTKAGGGRRYWVSRNLEGVLNFV